MMLSNLFQICCFNSKDFTVKTYQFGKKDETSIFNETSCISKHIINQ